MTRVSFRQRYEQVAKIGAGGMGEVFKGYDARSGRWVAIKLLHQSIAADPTARLRFEREIKTQAELDHTNIAPLFGVEDFKEGPCMIMQYVDGIGLNLLIASGRPLQPGIAYSILEGILAGMAHAHAAGIIHRDLKLSNILIGKRGIPKIIDFGIAKQEGDQDVTRTGSAPGTVSYMAPELHTASEPASTRSDVFSLGIIAYELFTGTHPFRRETEFATAKAILSETPPSLRALVPELPESLSRVVMTALEKEPARRFRNAEELRTEVARCGVGPASEQDVRSFVKGSLPAATGDQPEASASNSSLRAPAARALSRPIFGLLRVNWMFYLAAIVLLTGAAVYFLVSVTKQKRTAPDATTAAPTVPLPPPDAGALPPSDNSQTSAPPAVAAPGAAIPSGVPAPVVGAKPATIENPAAVPKKSAEDLGKARPAATRATKEDPAAQEKKSIDILLKGKLPEDR